MKFTMCDIGNTVTSYFGLGKPFSAADIPLENFRGDRLILITIDALGKENLERHKDKAPFLSSYMDKIVEIESRLPCKTAVNLTSMATGLEHSEHGVTTKNDTIKNKTFFEYMRRCGLKTGICSIAGSTLDKLFSPIAEDALLAQFPEDQFTEFLLLKAIEHRSHNFIWCHFMDLDKEGHRNGPDSAEVMKKLSQTDKRVEKIAALCKKYGYSLILNSDHGQHLSPEKFIYGVHDGSCKEDLNALFLQLV